MGKAGRPPKICKHGLKKWDCKTCVNAWKKDYYENHLSKGNLKSGKPHGKYKKDAKFPNYDLSERAREFVKEHYWSKSIITRFFYLNCVAEQRHGTASDYCGNGVSGVYLTEKQYEG